MEIGLKELVICHLDEGVSLNMELTAAAGKGYQPAVMNRPVPSAGRQAGRSG